MLLFDGQPAAIKQDTSFKFTRENPALSEKGEFTLEVALPMMGQTNNTAIFGPITRKEGFNPQERLGGSFRLLSDRLCAKGKYIVTEITNKEVKVQLVAKRSEANYEALDQNGNNLYIDEMDLGYCWEKVTNRFSVRIADLLPHWTVKDFLTEVSNFLNVVIYFGEDGIVSIIPRASYYTDEMQEITDVVDDYTGDLEDESQEENSSTGNVDYEWPVTDDMLRLPDEVWEQADVRWFANMSELNAFVSTVNDADRMDSPLLLCERNGPSAWAFLENTDGVWLLTKLDYYPPVLRDSSTRDIKTKMRIVPARMKSVNWPSFSSPIPVLITGGSLSKSNFFSVNNEVNPDSPTASENTTEEKPDVMEVAFSGDNDFCITFDNPAAGVQSWFNTPIGVLVEKSSTIGLPVLMTNYVNRGQQYVFPEKSPRTKLSPCEDAGACN